MAGNAERRAHRRAGVVLAALCALASSRALAGDAFSPGDLAQAHQDLEGIANCTKCHVQGGKLDEERCLACHTELKSRVAAGTGFHGKLAPTDRSCELCHKDHQGRDFQLIDWGAGKKTFDHRKTGFPLVGKHKGQACTACHEPRLIQDKSIRELIVKSPKRETYLGLATACSVCHFDEHRGQLGNDCKACHDESAFKPAKGFLHSKSAFALTGKHAQADCIKCHVQEPDKTSAAGIFPAPHAMEFARFKPVVHDSCTACHKDPHEGKFGGDCASCHATESWKEVHATGAGGNGSLHDKTNFPLRGLHSKVACKTCHGPFPGEKARFKGLAYQNCTDCHADAHQGQFGPAGSPQADCTRCHDVNGFLPAHFELEEHAKSRWPLEGAHRAIACVTCHQRYPALEKRFPAALAKDLRAHGRPVKQSLTLFKQRADPLRCDSCHADAHAGQFEERVQREDCAACHVATSFRTLRFDHAKDSRFPLEGKHATVACSACHAREPALSAAKASSAMASAASSIRFRPVDTACANCHRDPHAGQFAQGAATDCLRCHSVQGWTPTRFVHAPPFTQFVLEGKHQALTCEACHVPVALANGKSSRRYKPLPQTCEGCHADVHSGAMKRFAR